LPSLLPLHLPRGTSCENTPRATPRSGKREVLLTKLTNHVGRSMLWCRAGGERGVFDPHTQESP
jgi:hypothetical protein